MNLWIRVFIILPSEVGHICTYEVTGPGSWNVVTDLKSLTVSVYHNKVKKVYSKYSAGDKDNPGWQMGNEELYSLNELMEINVSVKKIRETGGEIIKKTDNGDFEYI